MYNTAADLRSRPHRTDIKGPLVVFVVVLVVAFVGCRSPRDRIDPHRWVRAGREGAGHRRRWIHPMQQEARYTPVDTGATGSPVPVYIEHNAHSNCFYTPNFDITIIL